MIDKTALAVRVMKPAGVLIAQAGRRIPMPLVHYGDAVMNRVYTAQWLKAAGLSPRRLVSSREAVFRRLAREVGNQPLCYLEFGVCNGGSLRQWLLLNDHRDSAFIGFDSFEGLPEDWNMHYPRGTFSLNGQPPRFSDERVTLVPGLFGDTLPNYRLDTEAHSQWVVNVDCDLYSSAHDVLVHIVHRLPVGFFLYFDEFFDRQHELRAFQEYLRFSGHSFRAVVGTYDYRHIAFQRTA